MYIPNFIIFAFEYFVSIISELIDTTKLGSIEVINYIKMNFMKIQVMINSFADSGDDILLEGSPLHIHRSTNILSSKKDASFW